MKIDTSILRNEMQIPIEVGDTTEDFNEGWGRCAEEVEKAIQRAEKKTMQVDEVPHDIPGVSDAVQDFWDNTKSFEGSIELENKNVDELKEAWENAPTYTELSHEITLENPTIKNIQPDRYSLVEDLVKWAIENGKFVNINEYDSSFSINISESED